MTRQAVINKLKSRFRIQELVGKRTYKKHGDRAWKFFSFRLLHTLWILRKEIGRPITINTWHKGGRFSQRGLRTNVQDIFRGFFMSLRLYLSAHVLGEAIDFDVEGMTAEEVRNWIIRNQSKFPYKIRLEHKKNGKPIKWVHLDVLEEPQNPHIYLFNV